MKIKNYHSLYDVIGFISEIQTSLTENYKELEKQFNWDITDARLNVFFNCCDLAANSRLAIGLLGYSKTELYKKEWWGKWAMYDIDRAFTRIPNFELYVDDKCRQFIHRVQEQLFFTIQIYIEAFIRNLARQFSIEKDFFWDLKKSLLVDILEFSDEELQPLVIYQHLKNTLHNKGLHNNKKYTELNFIMDDCEFSFKNGEAVLIGWEHINKLIVANSNLLKNIVSHKKVSVLAGFIDKNIVILRDEE